MKSKSIIGTLIVVGIVVIGAIYFMSSTPTQATTSTNTGLNSSALNTPSATNGVTKSNNKNIHTQNNSNQDNKNNNQNNNENNNNNQNNNNNNNNNKKNNNQNNNENKNNNQNNNENNKNNNNGNNNGNNNNSQSTDKSKKSTINTGTGNFADIIAGANYMTGTIDGTGIIIPLQGGHVINNMLVLPEYYTSRLNEKFTAKIASLGNNNFVLYEYYNGKNTAIFKLNYLSNQYAPTLSGTFTHTGSNEVTGITFHLVTTDNSGPLQAMPFYHTNISGTPVTITVDGSTFKYYEKYAGDNNIFTLTNNYNITNKKYNNGLVESFNGKTTGEYLLNQIGQTGNYSGIFISKPGTSESKTSNVTLKGNLTP